MYEMLRIDFSAQALDYETQRLAAAQSAEQAHADTADVEVVDDARSVVDEVNARIKQAEKTVLERVDQLGQQTEKRLLEAEQKIAKPSTTPGKGRQSRTSVQKYCIDLEETAIPSPHVINGARLKCSFDAAPSTLTVLPINRMLSSNQPAATIMDHQPMVNIQPFSMCACVCTTRGEPADPFRGQARHLRWQRPRMRCRRAPLRGRLNGQHTRRPAVIALFLFD